MQKATLCITTPARLSLRYRQLVITSADGVELATRPIEDIGVLIIENQRASVTMPLLTYLAEQNVAVAICDGHSMPSAMVMPLASNAVQAECYRFQLDATEPTKKQLWRQIVESKIRNQALVLDLADKRGSLLRPYYTNVRSGDTDNREGAAARIYWRELFGPDFTRERDGPPPNGLLNYGYAVLRAATTRALVGSGLAPMFGVFHRSRYNAFPLSDDVMEPYRPVVDRIVCRLYDEGQALVTKDAKVALLSLLTAVVRFGGANHKLEQALTLTTASVVRYFRGEVKAVALPEII